MKENRDTSILCLAAGGLLFLSEPKTRGGSISSPKRGLAGTVFSRRKVVPRRFIDSRGNNDTVPRVPLALFPCSPAALVITLEPYRG